MASATITTAASGDTNNLAMEIPSFVRVYNDGTIERLQNSPIVPPSVEDPKTGVSSKDIIISRDPCISVRLYLPKLIQAEQDGRKIPILVYFHGGGFFFESAFNTLHQSYFNLFVSEANVLVVSVEYRLAPEFPLPTAYEDCWDALKWVTTHSTESPNDPEPWLVNCGDFDRIFIGGDSAGGNIVNNIAMHAGAEVLPGEVKIAGAFLSHPYFYGSKPIGSEPVVGFEETVPFLVWNFVNPTAAGGADNPMINPLAAGAPSFGGLGCKKILVCVAGKDILRDRGIWYYECVKNSGWKGEIELFDVEDEDHTFHIHFPECENGKKMMKRFADFLGN